MEQVASAGEQILAAIAPLEKDLDKAVGAKKGAITKHIHRIVDALLLGEDLVEDDQPYVSGIDFKNLDKARDSATACSRTSLTRGSRARTFVS